jgi:hypothetical protein
MLCSVNSVTNCRICRQYRFPEFWIREASRLLLAFAFCSVPPTPFSSTSVSKIRCADSEFVPIRVHSWLKMIGFPFPGFEFRVSTIPAP